MKIQIYKNTKLWNAAVKKLNTRFGKKEKIEDNISKQKWTLTCDNIQLKKKKILVLMFWNTKLKKIKFKT